MNIGFPVQFCKNSTQIVDNSTQLKAQSHLLFGIIRNQAEPAGMKNFQNSSHIREGISNPSHTRGGMSRNAIWIKILCIFLDMRFDGVLNYVWTHSRANRDVPTAFEPHSSGNRKIPTAFEVHSSWILLISKIINSGSNRDVFELHSCSFEAHSGHSGRIWSGLPFRFSLECDQNVSNDIGMMNEYLKASFSNYTNLGRSVLHTLKFQL